MGWLDIFKRGWALMQVDPLLLVILVGVGAAAAWWFRGHIYAGITDRLRTRADVEGSRRQLAEEKLASQSGEVTRGLDAVRIAVDTLLT
jgi:hypothetical protein